MSGKLKLVYVNNQIQLQMCGLYRHRHAVIEKHHVCPESWYVKANKPVTSPLANLCPDCHMSVHVCIDGIIGNKDISYLPIRCRILARGGFKIAQEQGLTPSRTL